MPLKPTQLHAAIRGALGISTAPIYKVEQYAKHLLQSTLDSGNNLPQQSIDPRALNTYLGEKGKSRFSFRINSPWRGILELLGIDDKHAPLLIIVPSFTDAKMLTHTLDIHENTYSMLQGKTQSPKEYMDTLFHSNEKIHIMCLQDFHRKNKPTLKQWNNFGSICFLNTTSFSGSTYKWLVKTSSQEGVHAKVFHAAFSPTYIEDKNLGKYLDADYGGARIEDMPGEIQFTDVSTPEELIDDTLGKGKTILYIDSESDIETTIGKLDESIHTYSLTGGNIYSALSEFQNSNSGVLIVPKSFAGYIELVSDRVIISCPINTDELIKIIQSAKSVLRYGKSTEIISCPQHIPQHKHLRNSLNIRDSLLSVSQKAADTIEQTSNGSKSILGVGGGSGKNLQGAEAAISNVHETGKEHVETKSDDDLCKEAKEELKKKGVTDRIVFMYASKDYIIQLKQGSPHFSELFKRYKIKNRLLEAEGVRRGSIVKLLDILGAMIGLEIHTEEEYIKQSKEFLETQGITDEFTAIDFPIKSWRLFDKPALNYLHYKISGNGNGGQRTVLQMTPTNKDRLVTKIFGSNQREGLKEQVLTELREQLYINSVVDIHLYRNKGVRKIQELRKVFSGESNAARFFNLEKQKYIDEDDEQGYNPSQLRIDDIPLLAKVFFGGSANRKYINELCSAAINDFQEMLGYPRNHAPDKTPLPLKDEFMVLSVQDIKGMLQKQDGDLPYPYLSFFIHQGYKDIQEHKSGTTDRTGMLDIHKPSHLTEADKESIVNMLHISERSIAGYHIALQKELGMDREALTEKLECIEIEEIPGLRQQSKTLNIYIQARCQGNNETFIEELNKGEGLLKLMD